MRAWPWLVVVVGLSSACMAWKVTDQPLPEVLATQRDSLRITPHDGKRVVMAHPELVGDSLFGSQVVSRYSPGVPLRYAVADVARVEEWKHSGRKTLAGVAIVGSVVAISGMYVAMRHSFCEAGWCRGASADPIR
jgi:hypothetical protein